LVRLRTTSLLHQTEFGLERVKLTYNPKMTKKIRKAIVFSIVYELVAFPIAAETFHSDFFIGMIFLSSPVIYYWARLFIKSGR